MEPYREADHSELGDYAQHVSVAETLLAEFIGYPTRVQAMFQRGQVSPELLKNLQYEAAATWQRMWEQLGQARDIAARLGRDVTKFDLSRKRAGDIWGGGAELKLGAWRGDHRRRTRVVTWNVSPHEPARAAVAVLRGAIPEVVIPRAPKDEPMVDLRKRSMWPWIGAALVVAFIVSRIL